MFNEQYRKEGPLLGMLGLGGGIARARAAGGGFSSNALYAFSGNNTSTDETGNGNSALSFRIFNH